jgi:hypothetical protein
VTSITWSLVACSALLCCAVSRPFTQAPCRELARTPRTTQTQRTAASIGSGCYAFIRRECRTSPSANPRLLVCPANERPRHAHPGAGMLIVAAPSGTGGSPAAVTDGGARANMRRASSRRYAQSDRVAVRCFSACRSGDSARSGAGRLRLTAGVSCQCGSGSRRPAEARFEGDPAYAHVPHRLPRRLRPQRRQAPGRAGPGTIPALDRRPRRPARLGAAAPARLTPARPCHGVTARRRQHGGGCAGRAAGTDPTSTLS